MENLRINIGDASPFVPAATLENAEKESVRAIATLEEGTGEGSDFLGWETLPSLTDEGLISYIEATAARLRSLCDYIVVVGIGGSYLGAKAVIAALDDAFSTQKGKKPEVIFAGQNLSEDYLGELMELVSDSRFGIIVISKSGTTTEPAVAFRLLKDKLESAVGRKAAAERIVAVTDSRKGALRGMADKEGYKTFVIPDNVGGRFSVLTPVGLLPVAAAGYDIRRLIGGAADMEKRTLHASAENPSQIYAYMRNALYRTGKKIEILVNFSPKLHYFAEWWKQLYGESEGKDHKGIFPASVDFTTDLHSMGQWIQDGERTVFETVVEVKSPKKTLLIPDMDGDADGLGYIAGKHVEEVNRKAMEGTRMAHVDGGVPVIRVSVPELNEYHLGELIYFFEKSCGISGYLLGVNPFDQPGVEKYKTNMFKLLGKPGY